MGKLVRQLMYVLSFTLNFAPFSMSCRYKVKNPFRYLNASITSTRNLIFRIIFVALCWIFYISSMFFTQVLEAEFHSSTTLQSIFSAVRRWNPSSSQEPVHLTYQLVFGGRKVEELRSLQFTVCSIKCVWGWVTVMLMGVRNAFQTIFA